MKILITGAGGFVGRNLARLLPLYGHEVIAPTRHELDMTNFDQYKDFLTKHNPDAILHTAFKGHFGAQGSESAFTDNLKMYETLWMGDSENTDRATVIFGSGAEFDRRIPIEDAAEPRLFESWPIDSYGLSKNIIARRFLDGSFENGFDFMNPFLLRLFGCFGTDEPEFRFIKRSIMRLKQGLPIEIAKDKYMDFFYIDDVAAVVNHVISVQDDTMRHLNLTYGRKLKLSELGAIICQIMKVPENIVIQNPELDMPYTGRNTMLALHHIDLYGLEQGVARMVADLK